jgi:hypothetical protein
VSHPHSRWDEPAQGGFGVRQGSPLWMFSLGPDEEKNQTSKAAIFAALQNGM